MRRWWLIACVLFGAGVSTGPAQAGFDLGQMVEERVHFLKCLAWVYAPEMWLSYNGALYFYPRTEVDLDHLSTIQEARDNYLALTNRLPRYAIASAAIARSGVGENWQKKLVLPYSNTNANLTPTRDLNVRIVPQYEVLTNFTGGDALIATEEDVLFVMDYGRGFTDAYRTNAVLVREGTKSFKSSSGEYLQAEAFTNAGLSLEEIEVLRKITKACLTEALFPTPTNAMPSVVKVAENAVDPPKPKRAVQKSQTRSAVEDFEAHLMMAKDSSPYIQFLLAKDFLEGLGTPKDEKLGMEWMERAAKNGSGDAKAYLEKTPGNGNNTKRE